MKPPAIALYESPPPPPPRRIVEVRRVKATEQLRALVLCERPRWFGVHWCTDHSEPCDGPAETCSLHKKGIPSKVLGYVHCLCMDDRRQYFVEITDYASVSYEAAKGNLESLRGSLVCFIREKHHMKSPVTTTLLQADYTAVKLPAEADPVPTLQKLWQRGRR